MLSERARSSRRTQTDAERRLWFALRSRRLAGYKFRRQHPIGGFVVDFACTKYRLEHFHNESR
jgi:very-short-patch-repair endonuclease